MTVMLDSRILRRVAHKMLDDILDTAEALLECLGEEWTEDLERLTRERSTGVPSVAPTGSAEDQIVLDEPPPKATTAKSAPARPQKFPEATVSCRSSCSALEIAINLAAGVAQRLGLKPHGKATLDLHRGKLRVRCASGKGRAVYSGGPTGRLFFSVWADAFGVTEKHASEACTFQYDLQDALLIEPPAWLKRATATAPSAKQPTKDPKDVLPVSCKKLMNGSPLLKCAACGRGATVQCSRCQKLICDDCWEVHVRTHWHAQSKGKATTAARDARQAMRSQA